MNLLDECGKQFIRGYDERRLLRRNFHMAYPNSLDILTGDISFEESIRRFNSNNSEQNVYTLSTSKSNQ